MSALDHHAEFECYCRNRHAGTKLCKKNLDEKANEPDPRAGWHDISKYMQAVNKVQGINIWPNQHHPDETVSDYYGYAPDRQYFHLLRYAQPM